MGYNYEINVGVEIYPNVYKHCLSHITDEYDDDEWGQKSSEDKNQQFVWVNSGSGIIYLQRLEVIRNGKTEEDFILSQNVASMKSGESMNFFAFQQEIIDAKDNIEDFLREAEFEHTFQLDQLQISLTEQESPYMK